MGVVEGRAEQLAARDLLGDCYRKLADLYQFTGRDAEALPLLQKSGIKEAKGFGGFPIAGKFLRT